MFAGKTSREGKRMDNDEEKLKKQKVYEIGFLVSLLLLVIIQFLFFYYGLPKLTNSLTKSHSPSVTKVSTNT
jgi:hypothetical protein